MNRQAFTIIALAAPLLLFAPATAQADDPGLVLTLQSAADGATDVRPARLAALAVPDGTPPSSFLPPGPFRATWEGDLSVALRGDYTFSTAGNGTLDLTINGKPVALGKAVTLRKGKNHFVAAYQSPARGDATIRLLWSGDDFRAEPLAPTVFTHARSAALDRSGRLREGRALFAGLRCARCHAAPELAGAVGGDAVGQSAELARRELSSGFGAPIPADLKAQAMPELEADTPDLTGVGARLNADWVAAWVNDPRALRPDATMPRLLHGSADRAADVAAYLATLADRAPVGGRSIGEAAAGGRLFAALGCVVCHTLPDGTAEQGVKPGRVPLLYVKAKYKLAALEAYLRDPQEHYAWSAMPNFRLSAGEAGAVAAYLLSAGAAVSPAGAGDAARGKRVVETAGCLNCHAIRGVASAAKVPRLADLDAAGWSRGCLAADAASRRSAPDYALDADARQALLAFAALDPAARLGSLRREALPEYAERTYTALRCVGCHSRDSDAERWSGLAKETKHLGDELAGGRAGGAGAVGEGQVPAIEGGDQYRPPLTWAGEKLRPEWAAVFVAGRLDYKPRPYLTPRMPGFPARATLLTLGMAMEHGFPPVSPPYEAADAAKAVVGRTLIGPAGGFSCVSCHALGAARPLAPAEAPAINFMHVKERLRRDYYERWVMTPPRLWPGTKMPQFPDADGKTTLRDPYDGDAARQFDAIWNYLLGGRDVKSP